MATHRAYRQPLGDCPGILASREVMRPPDRKKAATLAGSGFDPDAGSGLLLDLVDAVASFGLRGLDLEAVLLGGGGEEAADAVRLPVGSLLDLGQGRALGPSDQFENLCALALGARGAGVLGGLRGLLGRLAGFVGAAALAPLAGFLPLGASFLGLAHFFEAAFIGASVAPCSATAAAVSVVVASVVVASVFIVMFVLSACDPRMTIHHSGWRNSQAER